MYARLILLLDPDRRLGPRMRRRGGRTRSRVAARSVQDGRDLARRAHELVVRANVSRQVEPFGPYVGPARPRTRGGV